jgi:hypothetical protein
MNGGEKKLKNHESSLRFIWIHKSLNISGRENLAITLNLSFNFENVSHWWNHIVGPQPKLVPVQNLLYECTCHNITLYLNFHFTIPVTHNLNHNNYNQPTVIACKQEQVNHACLHAHWKIQSLAMANTYTQTQFLKA